MYKINTIIVSLFCFTLISFSQQSFEIELVESIPIETTLDNPDIRNTQEVWLEMINSAKHTLDIEQFYISNEKGEPLDTVLNAIIAAANRGVNVRIIVDAGMYNTYPAEPNWLDAESYNIEVRKINIKSLTGGIQHAKFFIVDGKQVFIGSQNFDWRAIKHIHELGVVVNDDDFSRHLLNVFNADWNYCESGKWTAEKIIISPFFYNYVQNENRSINYWLSICPKEYSVSSDWWDRNFILQMIEKAEKEITLQFLSYNVNYKGEYWSEVDSALIKASERGVKVKLIVSDWNLGNTATDHFIDLISHPNIEIRYTEIPEYSGGYIPFARVEHCKFITADSVCWIGTSNMSKDYFYKSRNVGVVIENGKFTKRVRDIFYKSWNSEYAHKIEPDGVYEVRKHGE